MNALMYLVIRFAVPLWRTSSRVVVAFWFLFMNVANLYDYVPIRSGPRTVMCGNGSGLCTRHRGGSM